MKDGWEVNAQDNQQMIMGPFKIVVFAPRRDRTEWKFLLENIAEREGGSHHFSAPIGPEDEAKTQAIDMLRRVAARL